MSVSSMFMLIFNVSALLTTIFWILDIQSNIMLRILTFLYLHRKDQNEVPGDDCTFYNTKKSSSSCFSCFLLDPTFQAYVFQLLESSGCKLLVTKSITSTIHQIPIPPRVKSLPTAVPVCPRQNLSMPEI